MDEHICTIDGCARRRKYRLHCSTHYRRIRETGSSVPVHTMAASQARRFERQITAGKDDCWLWQGTLDAKGYGRFSADGRTVIAHRWSYQYHRSEIPAGLHIDHLCRNPQCVNPYHLEPVTGAENTRRGFWGDRTECVRGHEFTEATTVTRPNGSRYCLTCHNERRRAKKASRLPASTPRRRDVHTDKPHPVAGTAEGAGPPGARR